MSPIRIGGLSSGIDTEGMIKKLMAAERIPLDKLKQKKQKEEWKRDMYRETNSLLLELRNKLDQLRFTSIYSKKKLVSTDDSKVSVTTNGSPNLASYTVTEVSLAKTGNGASVKFKNNVQDAVTKLEDAGMGSDLTFNLSDGNLTGQITISKSEDINTAIQRINDKSAETGVKAVYSSTEKAIIFSSTTPGREISISNVSDTTNPLNIQDGSVMGTSDTPGTNTFGTEENSSAVGYYAKAPVPGSATINGVSYTLTNNMLTVDGITFTFKADMSTPVTINAVPDTDSIVNTIKDFVDKYNEVIDLLNKKIAEPIERKYQPLTDEERESLSEDQIKKWEEKAKSGLLHSDTIIRKSLDSMRQAFFTAVSGVDPTLDTLGKIGIATKKPDGNKFNYMEKGKIYVDEEKLRESLEQKPDLVTKLFTKRGNTFEEKGLATRLYEQVNATMDEIKKIAGNSSTSSYASYSMGINLKRYDDQINLWEDKLLKKENYYWKQFSAMETAMNKYNSQGAWLASQLGGQ
jgi:flagellar hook-associated protein 2